MIEEFMKFLSGGSLFLFDRKALRYFRKDGHSWRKKKDGKTVREAHEKLKSGSIDVLHCYYAHGEDNENFQRRSYWLLDGNLEHIVLVHYRDVNEGINSSVPCLLNSDSGSINCTLGAQSSSGQSLSSEFEEADSVVDYGDPAGFGKPINAFYLPQGNPRNSTLSEGQHIAHGTSQLTGLHCQINCGVDASSSTLPEALNYAINSSTKTEILRKYANFQEQKILSVQPNCVSSMPVAMTDSVMCSDKGTYDKQELLTVSPEHAIMGSDTRSVQVKEVYKTNAYNPVNTKLEVDGAPDTYHVTDEYHFSAAPQFGSTKDSQVNFTVSGQHLEFTNEASYLKDYALGDVDYTGHGDLKKLDSFGRWMNKEMGRDCDNSLMTSESGSYLRSFDTQNDSKEVTSLFRHMQLDMDLLGPSISQNQSFSIIDFSPDWAWAFSKVETKVLISGTFLGGIDPSSIKWCCMFGEHEVPAEVLTGNVLRCQAPSHAPGRVPFYVTCSNRLACSEVREFEFREDFISSTLVSRRRVSREEIHLQVQFAKLLSARVVACPLENCTKCALVNELFLNLSMDDNGWDRLKEQSKASSVHKGDVADVLIQMLLKGKLRDWLHAKAHEEGRGPNILDEEGLGAIHYAAALGYEWAIWPIVSAGGNPNFRDAHGKTGLHWAAFYGREEAVVQLIRLGTAPGAVQDPTSASPGGHTAADLASNRGHKGIAGYLAEADLTSHLSAITLKDNMMGNDSVDLAAKKAIEAVQDPSVDPANGKKDEQIPFRGSLAAVWNSAQAAARIQSAFRVLSFRHRQLMRLKDEKPEIPNEAIIVSSLSSKLQKLNHYSDALRAAAAVKIQRKYFGWRGRTDFLKIRDRIVKIQAHVRGHQVRKQYKKVVWSVSIVEKAILRWRRKGAGLRGFHADKLGVSVALKDGTTDDYEFLRLGRKQKAAAVEKALARVQSMARNPEGRDQYMRLVTSSSRSKLGEGGM
ncbi:P-loop containing nucleoside triphosphate hydrolase protein [Dioscorea alata]|uniref:P-loop containing nucleoside triphosphate hydrolase protein n=1 Tax=Dioscorea alata TaxID=55571 RepID=A0ACB7U4D8_DIOAL|nr:P-loop containing nucleoside triphosphate hydrolase protein [Dioscorea alata]